MPSWALESALKHPHRSRLVTSTLSELRRIDGEADLTWSSPDLHTGIWTIPPICIKAAGADAHRLCNTQRACPPSTPLVTLLLQRPTVATDPASYPAASRLGSLSVPLERGVDWMQQERVVLGWNTGCDNESQVRWRQVNWAVFWNHRCDSTRIILSLAKSLEPMA